MLLTFLTASLLESLLYGTFLPSVDVVPQRPAHLLPVTNMLLTLNRWYAPPTSLKNATKEEPTEIYTESNGKQQRLGVFV
jgi:outer membrane biosynthesis protein TonB